MFSVESLEFSAPEYRFHIARAKVVKKTRLTKFFGGENENKSKEFA